MGITPGTAWSNRQGALSWCANSFHGNSADFNKFCYDKSQSQYKQSAAQVLHTLILVCINTDISCIVLRAL
jgi:hypothetical protein